MTSIAPISLSMLGSDRWAASRDSVPIGSIELLGDRFEVSTADSHRVGHYREFSKALAALDGYRGLHHSWKALLAVAVLFGGAASVIAVYGFDVLFS